MKKTRVIPSFRARRQALIMIACTGLLSAGCMSSATTNNTIKGNCNGAGVNNSASCISVQSRAASATTPGRMARTSTPAPSTPVATPALAAPIAQSAPEDTPIYQDKEVNIANGYVNVDTDQFLPSQSLGVRVSEGATGLILDNTGYDKGMRLAIYSLTSRPGREACIAQLDQVAGNAGMYTRDATAGQYVCLRTAEKNIAVIQFKAISDGTFGPIAADITLYRNLFAPLASAHIVHLPRRGRADSLE
jgi:hypothetical protein